MGKIFKFMGTTCLAVAALIGVVGPASLVGIAVEEIPSSIKNKR